MKRKLKRDDRILDYYDIASQWLKLKYAGKEFTSFFEKNKYSTIAIYGMGDLGWYLYEELKDTHIEIAYGIDKSVTASAGDSPLKIISISEVGKNLDAVIVTPTFAFGAIKEDLIKQGVSCPIISLLYLIYNIF